MELFPGEAISVAASPIPKPPKRIPSLDGIRAGSLILVILGHASTVKGFPSVGLAASYPELGVRVFFVISGLLITTLLLNELQDSGTISLGPFYRKRGYRIFPAAYAYLVVVTLVQWRSTRWSELLAAWTYTENFLTQRTWWFAHLWSLAVEEQFYLLWPLALLRWWRIRKEVLFAAIAVAPIFRVATYLLGRKSLSTSAFPCVDDALAVGCLLALYRDEIDFSRFDKFLIPLIVVTLSLGQLQLPHGVAPLIVPSLTNFGIAIVVENCVRKRYRVLNWKPLIWIGTLSYSIYLWQMPFTNADWHSIWTGFPLGLISAFACGCASYYLVERPFLRLRDKRRYAAHSVPIAG